MLHQLLKSEAELRLYHVINKFPNIDQRKHHHALNLSKPHLGALDTHQF
jgi:hypothetical protein